MDKEENNRDYAISAGGEPEETQAEQTGAAEASPDVVSVEDPGARLEAVTAERDRLAGEVAALKDQLLRRQADFENFRRRVDRERNELFQYAGMEMARELLPVLDDFERALEAAPKRDGEWGEYVRGIEIIYQRFADTLKRMGLEPIESVGQPFDPNVHHAIESVETAEAEDHTVLEELQRGYNFRGRLLREAMVRVAVKPSPAPENN